MVCTDRVQVKPNQVYVVFSGESTEVKPTEGIAPGSYFLENDTGILYYLTLAGVWAVFGGGE